MTENPIYQLKKDQLLKLSQYRDGLRKTPDLQWLFFEITSRCNLHCLHCGSRCGQEGTSLSCNSIINTIKTLPDRHTMICLTGGEPLLHPDFFEIASAVHENGFGWGMTTNGTLIDASKAKALRSAHMDTVSVSIDGLEETHDKLLRVRGSWKKAINGIKCLQGQGFSPQVTTVVHAGNIGELEDIYSLVEELGIQSWRPINVEPIGRACESGSMMLSPQQFRQLIDFIQEKRYTQSCTMEVTYGCSHYLGIRKERMVRDNYFMCGAGLLVASVRSNGDICACLDIENLPELVQGNIHKDRFMDVWMHGFKVFRTDRTGSSRTCSSCEERRICGGDSAHTWDWRKQEPLLCGRDYCRTE